MRLSRTLLTLSLALSLTACGGGGGGLGEAIAEAFYQTFPAPGDGMFGSISEDGDIDRRDLLRVGDDATNTMWRAFGRWDLPDPRPGYVLESAKLLWTADNFVGFMRRDLGTLYVQEAPIGSLLNAGDYGVVGSPWRRVMDAETYEQIEVDFLSLVNRVYDRGQRRMGLRFRTADFRSDDDFRTDATYFYQPLVVLSWRRL